MSLNGGAESAIAHLTGRIILAESHNAALEAKIEHWKNEIRGELQVVAKAVESGQVDLRGQLIAIEKLLTKKKRPKKRTKRR